MANGMGRGGEKTDHITIEDEMAAYDALPSDLRAVLQDAPMNISVVNFMGKPHIRAALAEAPDPATFLKEGIERSYRQLMAQEMAR